MERALRVSSQQANGPVELQLKVPQLDLAERDHVAAFQVGLLDAVSRADFDGDRISRP